MKNKKLLTVLGVTTLLVGGLVINQNASPVSAADVSSLVKTYYNEGVYTKKTQIDLSEIAKGEIEQYFHGAVQLDRTTYYKGNALLMGDYDGGFDTINSGYGTDANGNMTHFRWDASTETSKVDYTVKKGQHANWKDKETDGMEGFYLTLEDMTHEGYFSSWTGNTYAVTSKDDKYLADFLAFTAPCLTDLFLDTNYFAVTEASPATLKIEENDKYLSLQIVLPGVSKGTVNNTSGILSEARVYKGNEQFNETESYSLVVNGTKHAMVEHTTAGEVKAEGVTLKAGDTFHVENAFGWEYNKVKNSEYSTGFTAPWEGSYDFYYHTTNLETWVTVPADPNAGIIKVYLDLNWANITEVWLNDVKMTKQSSNYGTYYVELQKDSVTSLKLNFKQSSSWWHIEKAGSKTWNTDNSISVSWTGGNSYKINNVNWTYQWDNQEHKWFTCSISQI